MRLFILVLLCLVGIDLAAQSAQPTTYALIVGLSQYREITPLQFADRDASAFAGFLTTQHVPEANIKLFLNQEATRLNILDELSSLTQALKAHDRFYFYFGGHGDLEANIGAENALLLLYDSYKTGYFKGNEYLQLSELKTWFDALAQKQVEVIFIADACHSGGLIGGKTGLSKTQQALQARWAGITKMLSCRSDEYSLEGKQWGGGRGLFSYHLVNGLTGRADANKDKRVSLKELNTYLTNNVVKEANPNVQTPVVVGRDAQLLSTVSAAGMAQLADYEKRNFPIITEVNLKGGDEKANAELISKLDTSLVNTYKRFTRALKEKRVSVYDDSTDNALLYYRKLTARNIPASVVQLMKRNLAAGLMERELTIMKNARARGAGYIAKNEEVLKAAIANLEETMKLFGKKNYMYNFLQARKWVLESQTTFPYIPPGHKSIDALSKEKEEKYLTYYNRERRLLLQAIALEPNMISTYALLATNYRDIRNAIHPSKQSIIDQMPDSSTYYQEKVVELLPNQASAHYSLASSYQQNQILPTDSRGNTVNRTHPKAVEHFEKAAKLDTNFTFAYMQLARLYMGGDIHDPNHNYDKAIEWYEKILKKDEAEERELLKLGVDKYIQAIKSDRYNPTKGNFTSLCYNYIHLYLLHKLKGDLVKADEYWQKLNKKSESIATAEVYLDNAQRLVCLFEWNEDEDNLRKALVLQEKALKLAEEALKSVSDKDKPLATLWYQYYLKALGAAHRSLKNYDKAEAYLKQAIAYPVPEGPFMGKMKLMGSGFIIPTNNGPEITVPLPIQDLRDGNYHYRIEANWEMFLLNYNQGKLDEAFAWLEKSFQVAVAEKGNDVSGEPLEIYITRGYPEMEDRFKALKAKYFPPTADKK